MGFDPQVGKWRRRALSVPLMLVAAALATALSPLVLVVAPIERLVAPRMALTRTFAMVLAYLWIELWGIAALTLIALGPADGLVERTHRVQLRWTTALYRTLTRLFSMREEVSGLEHGRTGPFILLLNHASTADTVLPMALVLAPADLHARFVLKRELLFDPCLDIAGLRLPNAFVRREHDPEGDRARVHQLASGLDDHSVILLYPEGTRFSPARRARRVAELRERGEEALARRAEALRHTLLPRPGGAVALLQRLPEVDVVLLTHAGLGAARSMGALLRGALVGQTVRVHLERYPAAAVPRGREEAFSWLVDRWEELDQRVAGWVAPTEP